MHLMREDGTAAVEFAFVLPILMTLIVGIAELGLALYNKEVITNASREGARAGVVISSPRPTDSQITNVVKSYLTSAGWDADKSIITVTGAQGSSGDDLTIRVNYPYRFSVLPNFVKDLSQDIILSAQTVMQLE